MNIRKLLRNRGLGINLIAGFSFLFLAVYGWGLSWKDLGSYLLAILVLLVGLISLAAVCGWLLRKLMGKADRVRADDESSPRDEAGTKPDAK
jgi:hypothetical protein